MTFSAKCDTLVTSLETPAKLEREHLDYSKGYIFPFREGRNYPFEWVNFPLVIQRLLQRIQQRKKQLARKRARGHLKAKKI